MENVNMGEINTNTINNTDMLVDTQMAVDTVINKFMVLDTSNFIRLKPLNLSDGWKYYTTEFIVREIRDEKAREFYELNKNFIETKNPSRETMKIVTTFAKLSNDLKCLSIPDLSILALGYELIKGLEMESLLRKEPVKYQVVETVKSKDKLNEKEIEEEKNVASSTNDEDDGFVEVKKNKKKDKFSKGNFMDNDEGEWITQENIDSKLNKFKIEEDMEEEKESTINVHISTSDFTVQNVALKMGIPVLGVDGMQIKKIKNYILKCCTCSNFIFDTARLFCEDCGYNTLMKLACSINAEGVLKIYDKKAEARLRGTQVY